MILIIILISIGIILMYISVKLPHEVLDFKFEKLLKYLFPKYDSEKFRSRKKICINKYYWICSEHLRKTPCVLNESNIMTLKIAPWYGPIEHSNIEIKQKQINNPLLLEIEPKTIDFEIEQVGPKSELSLTTAKEFIFLILPKNSGKKEIRLDFLVNNVFCGYWERELDIKERQFWLVLSKNSVLVIRLIGSIITLLGAVFGIISYFKL